MDDRAKRREETEEEREEREMYGGRVCVDCLGVVEDVDEDQRCEFCAEEARNEDDDENADE
jgi:hypothetical protein